MTKVIRETYTMKPSRSCFFGTRHFGHVLDFSPALRTALGIYEYLLGGLGMHHPFTFADDPEIEITNRKFLAIKRRYQIACCYSTQPLMLGTLVCNDRSVF